MEECLGFYRKIANRKDGGVPGYFDVSEAKIGKSPGMLSFFTPPIFESICLEKWLDGGKEI